MQTAEKLPETSTHQFALIADEATLLELEPEWDALVASSRADSLFLIWDYVSTW